MARGPNPFVRVVEEGDANDARTSPALFRLAHSSEHHSRHDMTRPAFAQHRGRILLFLAAVFLLVQVLGLMHAVLHDHARAGPSALSSEAVVEQSDGAAWVKALFSGHDSQADCDDFDQMTHADQVWFDAPQFDAQRPERIDIAIHAGWHLAQQAAGFLARGPPSRV